MRPGEGRGGLTLMWEGRGEGQEQFHEGLSNGSMTVDTMVPIKDKDEVMHQIKASQYKQIWFMGGMYYSSLWINK